MLVLTLSAWKEPLAVGGVTSSSCREGTFTARDTGVLRPDADMDARSGDFGPLRRSVGEGDFSGPTVGEEAVRISRRGGGRGLRLRGGNGLGGSIVFVDAASDEVSNEGGES